MFRALPSDCATDRSRHRPERLVSAVVAAFVQGELTPGDPFPEPCELARLCHIQRHEVLTAIGHLLAQRVLQQDRCGNLRIHPRAVPTIEMKQQAFLTRARQLVDEAHRWHLPDECLDPLFHQAAHGARP